ncbi:low affinity immunoglobulin epsilon Fc receptor-like [Neocloeon triangulifer]|uniref:low affinity immunoglobulin epsilon Fc receptor-like n=1 Tax=Neocloeon triangulifer TaxID=2078957 RepID=UPI00286ED3F1|nr:low affinity immunoglobulin epsilon Fc receptor-like [Neocloeon triangulifer]
MWSCAVVFVLFFAKSLAQTDFPSRCDELSDKLDSCLNNNELILKVFNETAKQLQKQCDESKEMAEKQAEKQEMEKKKLQMENDKLKVENEVMKAQMMQCEKEKEIEKAERQKCEKDKFECQLSKLTGTTSPPPVIPPNPVAAEDFSDVVQELRKCEKKVADLLTERLKYNLTNPIINGLQLMNLTSGTYYYDKQQRYSWKEAQALCKSLGLELASFETKNKLSSFWNAASSTVWGPWTSGSYYGHQPGEFHWANGQKISPSMWRLGQPDEFGFGKDSCVYVYDGALYDEPCTDKNHVICEQPFYHIG